MRRRNRANLADLPGAFLGDDEGRPGDDGGSLEEGVVRVGLRADVGGGQGRLLEEESDHAREGAFPLNVLL